MKINKLKKSALKNDKIILGSYHKKIKIASIKKIIFKRLYHISSIKVNKRIVKILLSTTEPRVSALKTSYPLRQSHNFL
jgi:hypothetical protein